jgi:hypothetical protein
VGIQQRTHLGEGTRGSIHSAPERRQGEEGAFEDEVNERIERLLCRRKVCDHTWWLSEAPAEKKMKEGAVRTSQMKVARSCHGAFLGRRARAAVDATRAMAATPASEYADVAVKTDGACVDSSIGASQDHEKAEDSRCSVGGRAENVTMVSVRCSVGTGAYGQLPRPLPPPLLTRLRDPR